MSLIQGIDPDSLLQGGWPLAPGWLKTSHLNMAAAQVIDPGSNHHDHAAQHLDASARHPLRLAAEASFSTHPPRAPGLHPHGEPTPLLAHTAAAAVTGHTLAAASSGRSPPAGEQTPPRPVVVSGGRPDSHALPVVGDRAATAPAHTAWLAEGPPAGCSWVAAGAHSNATGEATNEDLVTLLLEALEEFDQPPSATLPPPPVRLSGTPLPPPSAPHELAGSTAEAALAARAEAAPSLSPLLLLQHAALPAAPHELAGSTAEAALAARAEAAPSLSPLLLLQHAALPADSIFTLWWQACLIV
jgi:hypothetical protein